MSGLWGHIWIVNQFNGDVCLLKNEGMENGLGLAMKEHTDTEFLQRDHLNEREMKGMEICVGTKFKMNPGFCEHGNETSWLAEFSRFFKKYPAC